MDIKIEAPKHGNQTKLKAYYEEKLTQKYAVYDFVKSIDVKISAAAKGRTTVSLQCKPEKGKLLFASATHSNENKAFVEAMRKINAQIEKYKEVHYHSN